jgi:predicted acetyltransferase
MPFTVRPLSADDHTAAWDLGSTAFGYRDTPQPEGWNPNRNGQRTIGAFDEAGRLVAKAVDREQGQWFGGRIVPASGVAGVAVAPELRGQGLGRLVLTRLLAEARERGAAISTLFDTTPVPYRQLGWEEVGALTYYALPTIALAGIRAPQGIALRPAAEADVPALQEIYRTVARAGVGLMERSGPLFPASAADFIADYHGVTVAVDADGIIQGYASWDRNPGYDSTGKLTIDDLIGLTQPATAALLNMLAGWHSVAPTLVIRLSEPDPAHLLLSSAGRRVESRQPWMLRLIDAPAAVAARGWPAHLRGGVDLNIVDEVCPWHAGQRRLTLEDGAGRLTPGGAGTVLVTSRGLAMLYAGAASPALLRRAGLLTGGDSDTDAFLLAATAGPAPTLLDYF